LLQLVEDAARERAREIDLLSVIQISQRVPGHVIQVTVFKAFTGVLDYNDIHTHRQLKKYRWFYRGKGIKLNATLGPYKPIKDTIVQ
jgi:hypothetical protein